MAKLDTQTPKASRGRPRSFDRDTALEAAMRVFWEKGFASTSMTDLTSAMGVAAPSLYAAFGSKEDLFAETLDRYDAKVRGLTGGLFRQDQPLRDQVEASLRLSARLEGGDLPGGCMVMMACEQASELSDGLLDQLVPKRSCGTRLLEERLRRAVAEGDLAADADIDGLTQMYGVLQRGLSVSGRTGVGRQEMERAIRTAMQAWDALTRI